MERWAVATGNANDPLIWDGGTLPGVGDDVYANGFAVTINVNTQYASVRTTAGTTAVAGGTFNLSDGVTLRANAFAGTTGCVSFSGLTGTVANFIGNATGGTVNTARGVANMSSGTLNVTGDMFGGSTVGGTEGLRNQSAGGVVNLIGNAKGGGVVNTGYGAVCNTGTMNITGNCIAGDGNGTMGASVAVGAVLNLTGNALGSASTGHGVAISSVATVTINGNVIGGSSAVGSGVSNAVGTVVINGNVTGGTAGSGVTFNNGSVTINGDCTGGDGLVAYGLNSTGGGTAIVNGTAIGSATGNSTAGVNSTGTIPVKIRKAKFGALGASPCRGQVVVSDVQQATVEVRNVALATQLLKFPFAGGAGFPISRLVQ